jgi:hypothetical protein
LQQALAVLQQQHHLAAAIVTVGQDGQQLLMLVLAVCCCLLTGKSAERGGCASLLPIPTRSMPTGCCNFATALLAVFALDLIALV